MENVNEFQDYIFERRKELGISRETIAEKTFISTMTLSKWERHQTDIRLSNLIDVLNVLGCHLEIKED